MPDQPHVSVQTPYALHAPEGHATPPPGNGNKATGQPRAGEDEPESTRDNDERVEATSHKGRHQDQAGCDEHAAEKDAPATPGSDQSSKR
ncbi:hypothetical protein LV478_11940 [Komagataeibacter oboediens]|uniref:hypothetical protein n=1 Tax=Komagataeibacter oboediens TaxID=65958 RepID=UPI001905CF99|nr:hypothetical protein [Komagataeibacter oboediens]WEQ51241.1 hypothetical protein LV478_11940 [Komagataeibacter oboediens]GCE79935.1 hypothetical protein MSKU3_1410 [Komagataeibacter oboediens]